MIHFIKEEYQRNSQRYIPYKLRSPIKLTSGIKTIIAPSSILGDANNSANKNET